MNITDIN